MKAIFASAGCWIVKRRLQVVLAQKPAEDAMGFVGPALIAGEPVRLKTSGDGGTGFDGLLIEAGLLRAPGEASVGADGHKYLRVTAVLRSDEPLQRLDSGREHF